MYFTAAKRFVVLGALFSFLFLIGCSGMELAPKKGIWYYPEELPQAERAVNNAMIAGKDKECPAAFNEAKNLKDDAYATYLSCRTEKGIEMALEATKKAQALCPAKPKAEAMPAELKPAAKVIDRFTLTINFDFNKTNILKSDAAQLKKGIDFIKKYPGSKIKLEGHTDAIGSEKYNQKLSEKRAEATKGYLVEKGGIEASRISTAGYGESKPIASNKTSKDRAKNRRVEILIFSD
jgi:outer membrane protein OmpA-like peptidoglycan-associated protein